MSHRQRSVASSQPADDLLSFQPLAKAGISKILAVTGDQNAGDFLRSNGKDFDLNDC
jgi:hypothetical protein